jgi:four helix bundle protein
MRLAWRGGSLYELQTQTKLAGDMKFIEPKATQQLLDLAVEVAKLINGLLGALESR